MFYHRRLINHFLHINEILAKFDAAAFLDMRTFVLQVKFQEHSESFYPQFLIETEQQIAYAHGLGANVTGFIGWVPYRSKRWPIALDKLAFKRYISHHGKRTPEYWLDVSSKPENFIIKHKGGSFGKGLRGPFKTVNRPETQLAEGEYYERFRRGKILKVWYWNELPICLEVREPPLVVGDGKTSLFELILSSYKLSGKALKRYEERKSDLLPLIKFQNEAADWNFVLLQGEKLQVDYLYGSSLYPDEPENKNQLNNLKGVLDNYLNECGLIFYQSIPEDIRKNTLYAVDGILSGDNEIRWLEMNCNPMCPPDAYAFMLSSIFDIKNVS